MGSSDELIEHQQIEELKEFEMAEMEREYYESIEYQATIAKEALEAIYGKIQVHKFPADKNISIKKTIEFLKEVEGGYFNSSTESR